MVNESLNACFANISLQSLFESLIQSNEDYIDKLFEIGSDLSFDASCSEINDSLSIGYYGFLASYDISIRDLRDVYIIQNTMLRFFLSKMESSIRFPDLPF